MHKYSEMKKKEKKKIRRRKKAQCVSQVIHGGHPLTLA
jgi:hypothetical protein